jgi:MoxR-like ATPase
MAPGSGRERLLGPVLPALAPVLLRLDGILQAAVAADGGPRDALGGVFLSQAAATRLVPGTAEPGPRRHLVVAEEQPAGSPLLTLGERFGLSPVELDVLALALAPELDARYGRLFGYLHDDLSRRRPSAGLAVALLGLPADQRLGLRRLLGPTAPLLRTGLLQLGAAPGDHGPPLPDREIAVCDRVVGFLMGDDALDPALAGAAELVETDRSGTGLEELVLADAVRGRLAAVAAGPGRLAHLRGPDGSGRPTAARALARAWGSRCVLRVDSRRLPLDDAGAFATVLGSIDREARLRDATVCWEHVDVLLEDRRWPQRALVHDGLPGGSPVVVCSSAEWPAVDRPAFADVVLRLPDAPQRAALWLRALGDRPGTAGEIPDEVIATVAATFRLGPGAIAAAADEARRAAGPAEVTSADLIAAVRRQGTDTLTGEAQRVDHTFAWADLVLPADRMSQLQGLRDRLRHRDLVHDRWGFGATLGPARGVAALFTGPSGTGKTMAAGVLADALGLELFRIDLAGVVSKYIGETEKNLARVFAAARSSNVVLFFDEADALFGKRTEVRDAHDRYANLEVAYLLQQIESYDGLVVLATNLRKNVDDAFLRRLQFVIEFPMPDAEHRRRIWQQIWPAAAPLDASLDLHLLATRYELSGGSIRNVAVEAAFSAAAAGCSIGPDQVQVALRHEHQKLGRVTADHPWTAAGNGSRPLAGSAR